MSPSLPKKGSLCVDTGEHLCKFLLFQNNELTRKGLVLSLNRCLGDVHTLYYLWTMLDEQQPITSMHVHRDPHFNSHVRRETNFLVHREPAESWLSAVVWGRVGSSVRNVSRTLFQRPPPPMSVFTVHSQAVHTIKEEYRKSHVFLPTNDIVASAIFGANTTSCSHDNVLVTVAMRDKLPEIRAESMTWWLC